MRNHLAVNNTKLISQNFGSNIKPEVGNDNGPKLLDNNNPLNLTNERNNIRIHFEKSLALNKKMLNYVSKINRYNIPTTMIERSAKSI